MPDPTPARTVGENGVAVYQTMNSSLGAFYRPVFDDDGCPRAPQSHVAFRKDEAEALVEVAYLAAESLKDSASWKVTARLERALYTLDAARKQRGSDTPENLTPDEQQGWVDHESAS